MAFRFLKSHVNVTKPGAFMKHYFDGHIGDLILFGAFVMALGTFALVFIITRQESNLLAGITMASLTALGTYMQKRPAQSTITNVDTANIAKVSTSETDKTEEN